MSKYTEDSHNFENTSGINFKTLDEIHWYLDKNLSVTVPEGFVFDVSVPYCLRLVFNPKDKQYLKAAALHDYLLQNGWTRLVAGGIFHDALLADGVTTWRRLLMWFSVSLWNYRKYYQSYLRGNLNGS